MVSEVANQQGQLQNEQVCNWLVLAYLCFQQQQTETNEQKEPEAQSNIIHIDVQPAEPESITPDAEQQ